MTDKVVKAEAEWQRQLSAEQYKVTRLKGTERAFTGKYHDCKKSGVYRCICCSQSLFDAETKYDSGTGWPSFFEPLSDDVVATDMDRSLFFMPRTEVLCSRCDAHLGHVFPDGSQPTGQRYCLNSVALELDEVDEKVEAEGE